ncbi:4Fe-4S binding protein [Huaxiibacter chinensis]|uniref:4Fe-4S binding protein n=1 Tax=Huaxiibacter chinensis TaxID=2899785 RepID=UPI003D317122
MAIFTFEPAMAIAQHCVRRRFRYATCKTCAGECPAQVFSPVEGGMNVDASMCIQCGNCLFVCPAEAISGPPPATRYYSGDTLVGPFSHQAPTVNELLLWHREYGIRFVALTPEQNEPWLLAIAQLNLVLKAYGEPVWGIKPPAVVAVNLARRSLFHVPREHVNSAAVRPGIRRVRQLFQEQSEIALSIDPSRCVMCSACWRACPEKCLRFDAGEVILDAAACTGCGGCAAVCLHQAVKLEKRRGLSAIKRLSASERTCRSCHRVFWALAPDVLHCSLCKHHLHGMRA